jgi:protein-S-isoprenylcysteine O-methyltransferase Ste14
MRRLRAALGSVVFFVTNPGLIGGLVPWALTGWRRSNGPLVIEVLGGALIAVGIVLLVVTIGRFVLEGRGTPHPIAPTTQLVVGGPYRHVRNPMYLGVIAAVVGQAILFGSVALLVYAVIIWVIVAAFVRFYEEPTLAERYGEQYELYRRAVPGWWPRFRSWSPRVTPPADSEVPDGPKPT